MSSRNTDCNATYALVCVVALRTSSQLLLNSVTSFLLVLKIFEVPIKLVDCGDMVPLMVAAFVVPCDFVGIHTYWLLAWHLSESFTNDTGWFVEFSNDKNVSWGLNFKSRFSFFCLSVFMIVFTMLNEFLNDFRMLPELVFFDCLFRSRSSIGVFLVL